MPRFNGINTDALEIFARKLLGIRQGGIMPSLSPEPQLGISFPSIADQYALAGYVPWAATGNIAPAGANTYPAVSLLNGLSDALMVVYGSMTTDGLGVCYLSRGPSLALAPIAPTSAAWLDTRRSLASFPLGAAGFSIGSGTIAVFPPGGHTTIMGVRHTNSGGPLYLPAPVVLSPGEGMAVYNGDDNSNATWTLWGFLKNILPDELTV